MRQWSGLCAKIADADGTEPPGVVGSASGSRRLPALTDDVVNKQKESNNHVLETIAIILLVLWLLGLVSSYTLGGFIHILLVVAIVMILVRLIQGKRG